MKIELKSIKYAAFASEETSCYSATLWVDGKKIGDVSNEGHGGCDRFHGDQAAYAAADAWCKANLPQWTINGEPGDTPFPTDLEMHCGALLEEFLIGRDMDSGLRTKALFTDPDRPGLFSVAYRGKIKPDARLFASVLDKTPGAVILNTLPRAEAIAIFKANAS